ncbi:hypothetical protein PVAND_015212 [Polypedilum vanderplanki]|uniref:Uncharacterized protein n=1 Tax=Polypedilum vanderplanki TaxID=319348 RepID=A0A9J6BBZ1_POLVA|nr:hypothetical protein PVAND_015212 [Polypedilum vanderplanki]
MKTSFWLISFIAFEAFKITYFFSINCLFEIRSYSYGRGYIYSCLTTDIPESTGSYVTEVTGEHLEGRNNYFVRFVEIDGNKTLSLFPRNFSHFFPNLAGFYVTNTLIKTLYGDELNEYGKRLEFFSFGYSSLKEVSSNLFGQTPNVEVVSFYNNKISHVGKNLFKPLNVSQMWHLQFYLNNCEGGLANYDEIPDLITIILNNCGYDDEFLITTTTTPTTTTMRTTTERLYCLSYDRKLRKVVKKYRTNN